MTELVLLLHFVALVYILPDYVVAAKSNGRSVIAWFLLAIAIYFLCLVVVMLPFFYFGRESRGIYAFVVPIVTCAAGTSLALIACRYLLPTPRRPLPEIRTAVLALTLGGLATLQHIQPKTLGPYVVAHNGPWKPGHAGELQRMGLLADFKGMLILAAILAVVIFACILGFNWRSKVSRVNA